MGVGSQMDGCAWAEQQGALILAMVSEDEMPRHEEYKILGMVQGKAVTRRLASDVLVNTPPHPRQRVMILVLTSCNTPLCSLPRSHHPCQRPAVQPEARSAGGAGRRPGHAAAVPAVAGGHTPARAALSLPAPGPGTHAARRLGGGIRAGCGAAGRRERGTRAGHAAHAPGRSPGAVPGAGGRGRRGRDPGPRPRDERAAGGGRAPGGHRAADPEGGPGTDRGAAVWTAGRTGGGGPGRRCAGAHPGLRRRCSS